jgi:hypothetical protein
VEKEKKNSCERRCSSAFSSYCIAFDACTSTNPRRQCLRRTTGCSSSLRSKNCSRPGSSQSKSSWDSPEDLPDAAVPHLLCKCPLGMPLRLPTQPLLERQVPQARTQGLRELRSSPLKPKVSSFFTPHFASRRRGAAVYRFI